MSTAGYDYDLFVIGGGSGGVRAARRAAMLGKKVAIAEEYRFGGTCVIRGCVPKKLLVYASQFSEAWEDARGYGWQFGEKRFDWAQLIANKDREIERLERIYHTNVEKAGAEVLMSRAVLEGPHEIRLTATDKRVTAETIIIATGGRPNPHPGLPGAEHCITSEEAFHLKRLPKSIVILGGGYIAVEFANIFLGLGVETTLVYRGQEILQGFDDDVRHELHQAMAKKGMQVRCRDTIEEVRQKADGRLEAHTACGDVLDADEVMLAIGRKANTENLGCEKAGVELDKRGAIVVDDYSRTSADNIYAVGDVTHRMQLTPVAIHEAMCLVETLYRNNPTKPDYDTVPTAVFSQPEIGTVGLTEHECGRDLRRDRSLQDDVPADEAYPLGPRREDDDQADRRRRQPEGGRNAYPRPGCRRTRTGSRHRGEGGRHQGSVRRDHGRAPDRGRGDRDHVPAELPGEERRAAG